jgi:hypothetical protein
LQFVVSWQDVVPFACLPPVQLPEIESPVDSELRFRVPLSQLYLDLELSQDRPPLVVPHAVHPLVRIHHPLIEADQPSGKFVSMPPLGPEFAKLLLSVLAGLSKLVRPGHDWRWVVQGRDVRAAIYDW